MTHSKLIGRTLLALGALATLQGCASLAGMRVSPLPRENASSQRSMLSLYNPIPFQHRSVSDGMWLRQPEDRSSRYLYIGY